MKTIRVVAAIIKSNNSIGEPIIFATQRGYGDFKGGWEFPGGKIEEGETLEQTLTRELHEELEIDVEIGKFFYQVEHDYPDFHLSMAVFDCKLISKEMKMNVHKGIKWLKAQDMMQLNWAAADIPVAELVAKGN